MSIDYSSLAQPKVRQDRPSYKRTREAHDRAFRRAVLDRDEQTCRRCGCRVVRALAAHPRRAEVHHAYGRIGWRRHEIRGAVTVCATCHDRITRGLVRIVPMTGSLFFSACDKDRVVKVYLDLSGPVMFQWR